MLITMKSSLKLYLWMQCVFYIQYINNNKWVSDHSVEIM